MSDNVTNYKPAHGYKVFRSDWTCSPDGNSKQYACPGKFEEEGPLSLCEHGMHFCKQLIAFLFTNLSRNIMLLKSSLMARF